MMVESNAPARRAPTLSETWERIKDPPLEFIHALGDPEFWKEFASCGVSGSDCNDRIWGSLGQSRILVSTGLNLGSNGFWADAGGGPSVGLIIGYDAKTDRWWNGYVNFGGGTHLGPKQAKFIGLGGGAVLSRDGWSWSGGAGTGRIGFGTDPVQGQSIGTSVMNKFGVSVGDRTIGMSRNIGFPNWRLSKSLERSLNALLPASMKGSWKWTLSVGGGLQGPIVEKGPSGIIFRWLVYPIEEYVQPKLKGVFSSSVDHFDPRDPREKLPGRK